MQLYQFKFQSTEGGINLRSMAQYGLDSVILLCTLRNGYGFLHRGTGFGSYSFNFGVALSLKSYPPLLPGFIKSLCENKESFLWLNVKR